MPDSCRLRSGSEIRTWAEGELLAFESADEHEAWNDSDRVRTVLLIDVATGPTMPKAALTEAAYTHLKRQFSEG